jgi:large subunit ribosomal protein L35
MPKMKTRRSAAKRYRKTATGKIRYKKQGRLHILTKKSTKRKRRLRKAGLLSEAEVRRARALLPYD